MRTFSSSKLLDVWERGLSQEPLQKALTLLSLYDAPSDIDAPVDLSIGRRDALLLQLRRQIFGSQLNGLTVCPECKETLELSVDANDFRTQEKEPPETLSVSQNGYNVRFRLPNSHDLEEISGLPADEAKNSLLQYCLLGVTQSRKRNFLFRDTSGGYYSRGGWHGSSRPPGEHRNQHRLPVLSSPLATTIRYRIVFVE